MRSIIALFVLTCLPSAETSSQPLLQIFNRLQETSVKGCDASLLPNWITWCQQGEVTKRTGTLLPEDTVCQSSKPDTPFLVCIHGRWRRKRTVPELDTSDVNYGRQKRDISRAYQNRFGSACSLFCSINFTGFTEKTPPTFADCPESVVLFPPGGYPNVTHNWTAPYALDYLGENVSSVVQVAGQDPGSNFTSAVSPGNNHVISYLATDRNNMDWPCIFTVTGEIPTCPPLVNLTDGNTTCSDTNLRGSTCQFTCNVGFTLNGTAITTCQDNGTWTDMDIEPSCNIVSCPDDFQGINITDADIVCENDTNIYESICWIFCQNGYLLRNDYLESDLVQALTDAVTMTTEAYNIASQEANEANDNATLAEQAVVDADLALTDAIKDFNNLSATYQTLLDNINTLNASLQQRLDAYQSALEDAAIAVENNLPNATELQASADQIAAEINSTLEEFEVFQTELTNLPNQLTAAADAVVSAEDAYNASAIASANAAAVVDVKESVAQEADTTKLSAIEEYFAVVLYQNIGNKVVPSYIRCLEDGTWDVPGDPYCEDTTLPEMECPSSFTVNLTYGENSRSVTWTSPQATDNSGGVTIERLFGPEPGSNLSLGQHHVAYQAVDVNGNMALQACDIFINVEVRSCDEVSGYLIDDTMEVTCDSYEVGASCNLTCDDLSVLSGPSTVTCRLNTTTTPPTPYWDIPDSYCLVETCPVPPTVEFGSWNCTGEPGGELTSSNGNDTDSDNTTSGFSCTVTCDEGYVLPFQTESVYTCDINGDWSSTNFPFECIEQEAELYSEYTLQLRYYVTDTCANEDIDTFMGNWEDILSTDMTSSYVECMMGYECSLGLMTSQCSDESGIVTIEFIVSITCVDYATQAQCDLGIDNMASLHTSILTTLETRDFFSNDTVNLAAPALVSVESDIATCGPGAVMNGNYCEKCGRGMHMFMPEQYGCLSCAPGSYSANAGRIACTTCPEMTTTLKFAAISVDECLDMCSPGSNSTNGTQPCLLCPLGMYQNTAGSSECIQCPSNTWSTFAGASNLGTDCLEYDIYMDSDIVDQELTNVTGQVSAVVWIKKVSSPPLIRLGIHNEEPDDYIFVFETSSFAQLMFDNGDNEPTDIVIEANVWIMVGITWDPANYTVTVYKDGEPAFNTTLQDLPDTDIYDRLVLSASSGTMISGLSVSTSAVSDDDMSSRFTNCSHRLPGYVYSMDNLAALRKHNFRFLPSTCLAANASITADYCGLNGCQNGGTCVHNDTECYTCNCTEQYGGPFCEEFLVHGMWSDWMDRTSCSRTCGTGMQERYRLCNNPPKSHYGDDCIGNNTEIVDCNLADCTECEDPPARNGEYCPLTDESCQPQCPDGFVLPRGQQGQTYHCGLSTGYKWTPLLRLPICAASIRPIGYTLRLTLTFVDPVPCDVVDIILPLINEKINNTVCIVEISVCKVQLTINGCVNLRRKRSTDASTLDATFDVRLNSNVAFDLPTYYRTSEMTESIEEALSAISALERTQQDLVDDPGVLNVEHNGQTYMFVADNVVSTATTNCGDAQTAVGGVCASCQAGTMYKDGNCVLCDRGTYQNLAGQTECNSCEPGKSTLYVGALSGTECIDVEFFPTDYTTIIIIVVACVIAVVILVLLTFIARRFYFSAKDREKYDMEADRVSLYTDFPDIAYNVYFKRRQVLGFDQDGFPIVSKTRYKTGDLTKKAMSDESDTDDGGLNESPLPTKEPFAYPEMESQDAPFGYDPYSLWHVEDMVPLDREVKFDFPRIKTAVRYRVPGKNHLAHAYPLEMFGYTDQIRGRTRKLLPMPVNIPVPKKLPQLLYRPPESTTLERRLSKDRDGLGYRDQEIGVHPRIPLLEAQSLSTAEEEEQTRRNSHIKISGPYSKKKGGSVNKRSLMQAITTSISPRSWTKTSARSTKSAKTTGRSLASAAASSPRMTKSAAIRTPRSASAKPPMDSHRPVKSATYIPPRTPRKAPPEETLSPRDALMAIITEKKKARQAFVDDDLTPHPKPSRMMMPKDMSKVSLPPPPPRSMLKDHQPTVDEIEEDEMRPATTISRKMVTIREEDVKEPRPVISVSVNYPVTPSGSQWTDPHVLKHQRPVSDARSARDTIVAPYSARPRSSFDKFLPAETKDTYRPSTSDRRSATPASHLDTDRRTATPGTSHPLFDKRPITPAFHPRPVLHKDVKVQRTQNFVMFEPPTNLSFNEAPSEPSSRMQRPPPAFLNKVAPRVSPRGSTGAGSSKFSPRDSMKRFSMKGFDDDEDEADLYNYRKNSFFFTEVPEDSELTERISSRRAGRRKSTNKPSPPPSYNDSRQDTVIEESMSMTFGEEE